MSSSEQAPGQNSRQNATQGKSRHGLPTSASLSGPDTSSTNMAEEEKKARQELQKSEVKRILNCANGQYHDYLGVKDICTRQEIQEASKRLRLLVHPDKNKNQGAADAMTRVNLATKELDVEPEEFAENAYGDEDPTDSDKENSTAGDMAHEIEKPDGYRTHIYEEATPILNLLMESPTDEGLKAK